MQEINLKPCPFCGSEPVAHEIPAHTHSPAIAKFMPDHAGSYVIECCDCACAGALRATEQEAREAWNDRTIEPQALLPDDIRDFIRCATLELQQHRSRNETQMDNLFQRAYSLYAAYDVENRRQEPVRDDLCLEEFLGGNYIMMTCALPKGHEGRHSPFAQFTIKS